MVLCRGAFAARERSPAVSKASALRAGSSQMIGVRPVRGAWVNDVSVGNPDLPNPLLEALRNHFMFEIEARRDLSRALLSKLVRVPLNREDYQLGITEALEDHPGGRPHSELLTRLRPGSYGAQRVGAGADGDAS
jgi:hypothetical protein